MKKKKFILSSAFPKGFLPIPYLPEKQIKLDQLFQIHYKKYNTDSGKYEIKKRLKKMEFMPVNLWKSVMNSYSPVGLYDKLLLQNENKNSLKKRTVTNLRNKINRLTGTTGDGNLFGERLTFYSENTIFESYLSTDIWNLDELKKHFDFIGRSGFGKKKSVGRGTFDINIEKFAFDKVENPNAHLVLSNMIPSKTDSTDAYWKGKTKFGKVGGDFALSEAPFKYPFHHFLPGSVFLGETPPEGTLMQEIHPDKPEIVQNLLCYSIPFVWEGKDEF